MATCELPASEVDHPSAAALYQIKELLQSDPPLPRPCAPPPPPRMRPSWPRSTAFRSRPRRSGAIAAPWPAAGCPPGGDDQALERLSPSGGIAPDPARVIVMVSALESAMSDGNPPSPASAMADDRRGSAGWDLFSQLQHTRQWEAEGSQLLRPADLHAWAAAGWTTPQ
jgi:hypothetical protein